MIQKIWNYDLVIPKICKKILILLLLLYTWTTFKTWLYYKIASCVLYEMEQERNSGALAPGEGEPGKLDHSNDKVTS